MHIWKHAPVICLLLLSAAAIETGFSEEKLSSDAQKACQKLKPSYRRPAEVPYPKENAYTPERAELGHTLFFDPRISGGGTMSCASCHNPAFSWGDGLPKGVGHRANQLGRRTPTILNAAWGELMFWDGRAASLEEQALKPAENPDEMGGSVANAITRFQSIPGYRTLFQKAYPNEGMTPAVIAKAIATYERGVVSGKAPFDRWVDGDDKAISVAAQRGFYLFNTKANCATCHSGWNFTDQGFHDIGVADEDNGRGKLMPMIPPLQHAFKTPTLRNAALRAPYLHNGSEATLADVVAFYNKGGKAKRPSLSDDVRSLHLTGKEQADLVEFLQTLTGEDAPTTVPVLPQ